MGERKREGGRIRAIEIGRDKKGDREGEKGKQRGKE